MTDREKIVGILDRYTHWNAYILKDDIDSIASEILPLIEKRDEIIQNQDELDNFIKKCFASGIYTFDITLINKETKLRQEISKLKGELK